jgi:CheY-like chemotaxis protein
VSWEWNIAVGIVAVLLIIVAGLLYDAVMALNRVEDKLDKLNVLEEKIVQEQATSRDHQNYRLDSIASAIHSPRGYVPPTVRFCDRCRKEYPESNRWWTAYQLGLAPFRLCAYPQQKERPEDKWLHGEECIMAETRAYMANVLRQRQQIGHKQKREYMEHSDFGSSDIHSLNVSHCGHCEKEYSESDFWWTVSAKEMEIEVREGFRYSSYRARDYYFCGERCVLEAVGVFIATQTDEMLKEKWNEYLMAIGRSNLRGWLAAQSATQVSPPAQAVPSVPTTQEIRSGKEPARHSIPRAAGRAVGWVLRRLSDTTRGHRRVLLVDDQEALVEVAGKMLTEAGYDVRSTLDATKAIAIAQEFNPHVALLGVVMPGIDGIKLSMEFVRHLPRTKVVFWADVWREREKVITPQVLNQWREQGYYFDILPSPFEKEELLKKMKAWVHEARSRQPTSEPAQ